MFVQGRSWPVQEGDGAEPRLRVRVGAGVSQGGLHGPQEDEQHGPGMAGIPVKEIPQPFGQGEHPLAVRNPGQNVVYQVGGGSDHVLGGARGTESPSLTAECSQKLIATGRTPTAGKAEAEDAVGEIPAEGLLDVFWYRVSVRVGLPAGGEPGLEVLLDKLALRQSES